MKNIFLFIATAILVSSTTAMADVKIKTKQTMSGQTTENTTYIKGKRQRTEMMGGVMVTVTQCDLGQDLQINPQTKTYVINFYDNGTEAQAGLAPASTTAPVTKGGTMFVTTTIKDTGERKQMFGYTARHIIQTIETETTPDACATSKTKMEMDMWVIDVEFGLACTQDRQNRPYKNRKSGGCQDKIVPKTIGSAKSGYPVWQKMTSYDANGKESFTMIQEVVELSKATLDQALFDKPADYREVKDASEMYTSAATSGLSYNGGSSSGSTSGATYNGSDPYAAAKAPSSGMASSIKNAATAPQPETPAAAPASTKKPGTVRVGIAVKTTSVGEGITANDLTAAVQNTFGSYLKGTKIEIVPLEAKLAAAMIGEAKEKECDFVLGVVASHKKGGSGGFGLGKMFSTVAQTGLLGAAGSAGVAAQVASQAIMTATSMSGSVKSKDELTIDVKLQSTADNSSPLAKQYKAKAKADGDDIISSIIEQAAQAILDAVGS